LNDRPKIQVEAPTVKEHSIMFPETGFRIPLLLWGTFSYFPTCKPTAMTMQGSDEIYMLTTDQFNPHHDPYAVNEDIMLDWEGNMVEKKHITENSEDKEETSPILDDMVLYQRLSARSKLGKFHVSIGLTDAPGNEYIIEDDATDQSTGESDDDESEEENDDRFLDKIYEGSTRGKIDLDQHFVSAAHVKRHGGVDAGHLFKVWKIDLEAAQQTLGVTTQQSQRTDNPKLLRN
jgi:hypothetical protein